MKQMTPAAVERAMKLQDVMLRAMANWITWFQAAEILGISYRQKAFVAEHKLSSSHFGGFRDAYRLGVSVASAQHFRQSLASNLHFRQWKLPKIPQLVED